jgi:uncharacterized protein YqgC (DUF456 family)
MSAISNIDWSLWGSIVVFALASLAGLILTLVTLPGTWLIVATAILTKVFWVPDFMPWWVIIVMVLLAVIAEVIEGVAGAVGAAKTGATKAGALGAVVGSIVGAICGSPFLFPLGTIAGACLGAAIGTLLVEVGYAKKTMKEGAWAGTGAAAGRFVAILVKSSLAGAIALLGASAILITRL